MSNFDHFVGTRPVSDQHAFDTAALSAWLAQHMRGFEGPLTVEMFKGGQSNPTYKLITPTTSYVMRAKPGPVAKLLPSAHAIEREFAVMSGLYGTDVPVPRMFVLCEDESVIGRAFYVMAHVAGRIFWEPTLPGMAPSRVQHFERNLPFVADLARYIVHDRTIIFVSYNTPEAFPDKIFSFRTETSQFFADRIFGHRFLSGVVCKPVEKLHHSNPVSYHYFPESFQLSFVFLGLH